VATQVIAEISQSYDVSTWLDTTTTPSLVRKIIAMEYVAWYFQRTYSEDDGINTYGVMLLAEAKNLIQGIISGSITLPDAPGDPVSTSQPVFYPTDASSALRASDTGWNTHLGDWTDRSVGSEKFSMGTIW